MTNFYLNVIIIIEREVRTMKEYRVYENFFGTIVLRKKTDNKEDAINWKNYLQSEYRNAWVEEKNK